MKVLFVCLGNICRSPTAEGVFKSIIKVDQELVHKVQADSAGTSAHHSGSPADSRSIEHAKLRGYDLISISRQLHKNDFFDFDLILTMDNSNYKNVITLAKQVDADLNKVKKFTDFCIVHDVEEVPDPYYYGSDGFELVLDIVEDGCQGLIQYIKLRC